MDLTHSRHVPASEAEPSARNMTSSFIFQPITGYRPATAKHNILIAQLWQLSGVINKVIGCHYEYMTVSLNSASCASSLAWRLIAGCCTAPERLFVYYESFVVTAASSFMKHWQQTNTNTRNQRWWRLRRRRGDEYEPRLTAVHSNLQQTHEDSLQCYSQWTFLSPVYTWRHQRWNNTDRTLHSADQPPTVTQHRYRESDRQ